MKDAHGGRLVKLVKNPPDSDVPPSLLLLDFNQNRDRCRCTATSTSPQAGEEPSPAETVLQRWGIEDAWVGSNALDTHVASRDLDLALMTEVSMSFVMTKTSCSEGYVFVRGCRSRCAIDLSHFL